MIFANSATQSSLKHTRTQTYMKPEFGDPQICHKKASVMFPTATSGRTHKFSAAHALIEILVGHCSSGRHSYLHKALQLHR